MSENENILQISNVSKSFPGVKALDEVSFSIRRGEIHSVVGENGAGKSTLTKIIAGIHTRDAGDLLYDGRLVDYRSIQESIEDDIYMVFQELSLCANLTVAENIYLGKLRLKFEEQRGFIHKRQLHREATRHLNDLKIRNIPTSTRVESLEVAQQQLVEIAKALVMKPKLLILDEPTSALTQDEVENLFALMQRLRDDGVTIILISHIIEDVYAISDTITVLRDGLHVVTKPKGELDVDEIVRLMVGREIKTMEVGRLEPREELLRIEALSTSKLKNVSLTVRKGEILGLMGLQGSGNADLLRCIYGRTRYTGDIFVDGRRTAIRNSGYAIKNGITYVPGDRKTEGLIDSLDIGFNLGFLSLKKTKRWGFVDRRKVYALARSVSRRLSLKYSSLRNSPFTLSGGNQQKVVIGKSISIDPGIVLLDDPTRGVDIGAKNEIYKIMFNMAANGRAVLFHSTELPELLSLCHRIVVFFNGKIVAEHDRENATEEILVAQACGLGSGRMSAD